jgi:hypothetical protein
MLSSCVGPLILKVADGAVFEIHSTLTGEWRVEHEKCEFSQQSNHPFPDRHI